MRQAGVGGDLLLKGPRQSLENHGLGKQKLMEQCDLYKP